MLLPQLDVMDSDYTTLYRIADDAVFHVYVPRTPAAETIGCHLDSSFVIFPDYGVVVVDRWRQEALHLSEETEPIYNFRQSSAKGMVVPFFATLQCFTAATPSIVFMLAWRASCPSISRFSRALPSWPFRGRLCFAERGRLRR